MIYEARETETGSWAVYEVETNKRFSDSFYMTEWAAQRAAEDIERAYMAGCSHGEQVKELQKLFTGIDRCPNDGCMLTAMESCSVCGYKAKVEAR